MRSVRQQLFQCLKSGALLIMLALLVLGCATNKDSQQTSNQVASQSETTENSSKQETAEPSDTRTYTDYMNRTSEYPTDLQRVAVVAGAGAIIDVLELGITPIGYPYRYIDDSPILKETHEKMAQTALDLGMPTNHEALLETAPELTVFGYETMDGEYEMLGKIGPVAAFDEQISYGERLLKIGEIVGKEEEARQLLEQLEQQIAAMWTDVRQQGLIGENDTAAVVVYYWNKRMYLMKNFAIADVINHPLGMPMSKEGAHLAETSPAMYIEIAEEVMPTTLTADHLFMLYAENEEAVDGFDVLKQNAVFQSLSAVKNDNVYFLPLSYNSDDLITLRKLVTDFPAILQGTNADKQQ